MEKIIVYGSYGYTGKLVVEECNRKNLAVVLSGRNEQALKRQSEQSGYPYKTVDINDHAGLVNLLKEGKVVIHCGGPFRHTATKMMNACLEANTHYTDITGEYAVFELLAGYDSQAKQAGLIVIPGTGFDVVPSDCLALHLKNKLPDATHLQLAFTMLKGGLSRGTKKSMTEGLGYGGMIRENGKLIPLPLGDKVMTVDFGEFKMKTLCIPWGDISTAWRSTGIPNIEVYTGATDSMIANARRSRYFNWLLRMKAVKKFMLKQIDKKTGGPSEEKLLTGKSYLWGKVTNASGQYVEARLETISGYWLTAKTSVLIAEKIIQGNFKPGYQTPAMAYGENLVMEIEGTKRW